MKGVERNRGGNGPVYLDNQQWPQLLGVGRGKEKME